MKQAERLGFSQQRLGRIRRLLQRFVAEGKLPGLGVSTMLDVSQSGVMGSNGDHGWGGYAEMVFWIDPQEEMVVINMTQCIPSSYYPVRPLLRTAVYQALIE